jgi:hypothetical protein
MTLSLLTPSPGSTYISLKSAILPSLSIARLDVILQHHFIFEFEDLKTDRNLGPGFAVGVGYDNDLARVYSDPSPILDPAKLADMEAYLGSKPGQSVTVTVGQNAFTMGWCWG